MRTSIRRAVAVLLLAAAAAGCNQPEIVTALERRFHLGVGRQAVFPQEQMELGFVRVVSDSRCPEGATCVWAGEAVVALSIGREGGSREAFEARLPASTHPDSATVVDHGEYRLRLIGLEPRPKAGVTTDSTSYVLELRVSHR
jgi:hypothetical protein